MPDISPIPQSSATTINNLNLPVDTVVLTNVTDAKATAAALIGTRSLPAGLGALVAFANEAQAYHVNEPYPLFYFQDWKTEERGPLPKCLPVSRRIVLRGARWLFGTPPVITCAANTKLEQFVQRTWKQNRLSSRLPAMAEHAGVAGGVVLKFDYDRSRTRRPVNIDALSLVNQVRLYYDPHDAESILMARIQYPFFNAAQGAVYWYREEWTADEYVTYEPFADSAMDAPLIGSDFSYNPYGGGARNPDGFEGWQIRSREKNEFGVIPVVHIKNMEAGDVWGLGDLWTLHRIVDRINLCYHLMDRSNQFDSEVNPIFVDLEVSDDDLNARQQPGQPLDVKSASERQGSVHFPRSGNALRPQMMDYAQDLRRMVNSAAGSVDVDPGDVTNKGNLTNAVLTQLYQPQIEMTNQKRLSWGDDGLTVFFALMAEGLANAGVHGLGYKPREEESYTVNLKWAPYFTMSEDEKAARVGRVSLEESLGYLTHERAIEEVADLEGRDDVSALKDDLVDEAEVKAKTAVKLAMDGIAVPINRATTGIPATSNDVALTAAAGEIKELNRMGGEAAA